MAVHQTSIITSFVPIASDVYFFTIIKIGATQPLDPSFPNSVWERSFAKLRFASRPGVKFRILETEFRKLRSQTEFGNEGGCYFFTLIKIGTLA
jgi:hypothetical protein